MLKREKPIHIVTVVLLLIAVQTIVFAEYFNIPNRKENSFQNNIVCIKDAKLCPDGSKIGPTGSNCEFALCPSEALCEGGECAKTVIAQVDTSDWQTYRNEEYGFEFKYPTQWKVKDVVLGTQFQLDAVCKSVEIVDSLSVPGGAAFILHSLMQVCVKPLIDGLSLNDFIRQTYKERFVSLFEVKDFNGIHAYQAVNKNPGDSSIFLQTKNYRIQISSIVVASPEKQAERLSQVQKVLSTFKFVE